jgi:di/tricarboxylate transporter
VTAELEKPRDVVGGLLTMAIGAGFLLVGQELEFGTSFRMGPGYFPTILSLLMIALGAVLTVLAWRAQTEEGAFGHVPWRGLLLVIGATLFFGFTLRGLGLAPVLVLIVLATAWASRYASWRTSVPLALGLAVFCTVLFIRLLGLPLLLLGPWADPQRWMAPETPPAVEAPAPAPAPAQ